MSFLFGKTKETKETEREEYERLLLNKENKEKKEKEIDKIRKKLIEDKIAKMKKTLKQYPNISFEEAILRTYSQTSIFYNEKEIVGNILTKIDLVYKQIKKCEEMNESIDDTFKDDKTINLERTIEKLEKMNTFGETFIPRI